MTAKRNAIVLHQWQRLNTANAGRGTDDAEQIDRVVVPVSKITKVVESTKYRRLLYTRTGEQVDAQFRSELYIGKEMLFVIETVDAVLALINGEG